MAKYTKVAGLPGLYLNENTKIYYVRKFLKGHGALFRSTKEKNLHKAKLEMTRILSWWLGAKAGKTAGILFRDVAMDLVQLYSVKAPATYNNFEIHYRLHIGPFFDDMPVGDVKKNWLRYCAKQKQLCSTRKLGHDRRHVRRVLQHAVDQEFLDGVPQLLLDRNEVIPSKGREYSNDDLRRIFKFLKGNQALKAEIQLKVGLRSHTVRLLKWEYIDFKRSMLFIDKSIVKTRDDIHLSIDPELLKKLETRRKASKSDYVFPHRFDANKPCSRTDKVWQRAKKKAGFTGKQHWFRHTAATRFIRGGTSAPLVQKAMGMSDKVMKDVYLHVNDEDREKMATAVGRSMKKH